MTNLMAARTQMGLSLGFHIIFAAIGMAMPFFMAISHWLWIRNSDEGDLYLTKKWSQGVAIFFATGAVSGTVLSFELGLLWPGFMKHAGSIIGMPFSWEGTAFFLEAIALGIFLYGWDKIPKTIHWVSGLAVGVFGVLSGLFVVCANAWMNTPRGFDWVDGRAVNIDPWAAMFNPASLVQGIHMTIASFAATGFAVAGIHALGVLRKPASVFHRKALKIALLIGAVASLLQPLQGDRLAKTVAIRQPEKLAAMELLYKTSKPAPLLVGTEKIGFYIPKLLSFLAHGDFKSEVTGLDAFPPDTWPPLAPTHFAFQLMVALGTFLALVGAFSIFAAFRQPARLYHPWFLKLLIFCTPLGFIALEAGWIVTEVGRQPWIIYGIMRTKDAVTPMPGLFYSMIAVTSIYLFLSFIVTWLMVRQFRHAH